jgi:nitroreductase
MDVFDAIRTRRSIRKYSDHVVSEDALDRILDAGMMAPSAGNAQPWQFVVIRDRKALKAAGVINPHAAMAKRAPVSILVCGDLSLEKFQGFWVQDCSAAIQNMLLAAHAMGLGSVWTGIYPLEDRVRGFRSLVGLPEHVVPLALIVIGHPAQNPQSERRYRADRVHRERWRDT